MRDPRHGEWQCYRRHKCGRPECRAAWSQYQKRWKYRRGAAGLAVVDATGTRRRLQALACIGYSRSVLAELTGLTQDTIRLMTRRTLVTQETAGRVKAVYSRYSMQLPAPSGAVTQTKDRAAAKGWLPPLVWNDDEIDNPEARPHGLNREQWLAYMKRGSHETRSRVVA